MRKFWQLSSADRGLLLKVGVLLAVYRAALSILPWRRVAGLRPLPRKSLTGKFSVERLEWSVRTAGRWIPGPTCLTQALALHHLLACAGCASSVQIGVAKTPDRGFAAHAWVEYEGATLLNSASEVAHYSRLMAFQAPSL